MWKKFRNLLGVSDKTTQPAAPSSKVFCCICRGQLKDRTRLVCNSCYSNAQRMLQQAATANKNLKERVETNEIQHKAIQRETHTVQARQSERIFELEKLVKAKQAPLPKLYSLLSKAYFEPLGLTNLYYIADMRNLPSILRKGILCKNRVEEKMIPYASFADEGIQAIRSEIQFGSKGGHDYVPLFFEPKPPMLYRLQKEYKDKSNPNKLIHICIRKELLLEEGVLFTDRNLASAHCKFYDSIENLTALDWETIRAPSWVGDTERKHIKGAEVLVPNCVDIVWFEKLVVYDEEARSEIQSSCNTNLPIEVNRDGFYF